MKLDNLPKKARMFFPRPIDPEVTQLHEETIEKIEQCGRDETIQLTIRELGQLWDNAIDGVNK